MRLNEGAFAIVWSLVAGSVVAGFFTDIIDLKGAYDALETKNRIRFVS